MERQETDVTSMSKQSSTIGKHL